MKTLLAILLLLSSPLLTSAALAETRDAQQYFFDMKMGDFKSELATARKEGKQGILIMFTLEDCPFCHRMKHTILNQSEVQDYYHQHFLIFEVDIRGDVPMTDFAGKQTTEKNFGTERRIYGTPVFDFYDLNGKLMTRFPGTARDVNEFMLLGRYVADGAYKSMPFTLYKKQSAQ
jgi:thioredoxin-related protein